MREYSTVSSKGQIVIPKKIRDLYGLGKFEKVIIEPAGKEIIIRPAKVEFIKGLEEKLKNFNVDPDFRSDWEKSLKKKLKKWDW
jgi:AbrB family looped-hinge helix DNA binding protein